MPPIPCKMNPMGSSLPAGYTKISAVKAHKLRPSPQGDYINTEVYTNPSISSPRDFIRLRFPEVETLNFKFGYRFFYENGTRLFYCLLHDVQTPLFIRVSGLSGSRIRGLTRTEWESAGVMPGSVLSLELSPTYVVVNDIQFNLPNIDKPGTIPRTMSPNPLQLLWTNNQAGAEYECYEYKHWENNVLTAHMVPVLDPAGNACMYDLVRKRTFYSGASGGKLIPIM